jgi:hypothetical protein
MGEEKEGERGRERERERGKRKTSFLPPSLLPFFFSSFLHSEAMLPRLASNSQAQEVILLQPPENLWHIYVCATAPTFVDYTHKVTLVQSSL